MVAFKSGTKTKRRGQSIQTTTHRLNITQSHRKLPRRKLTWLTNFFVSGGLISPMSSPGNIPLSLQQPQHTGGWQPSPTIPQTHYPQVSNPGPSGSSHPIQTQPHPTSILRNALTKPKPHHQATIHSSCPTPNVTIGREVQSSIAGVKSEPISTGRSAGTEEMEAVEEMENQVLLSNTNPPSGQAVAAQTTHKIKVHLPSKNIRKIRVVSKLGAHISELYKTE